jgi:hypothetical protein
MKKLLWIAPIIVLVGCSKSPVATASSAPVSSAQPAADSAATPSPEPVAAPSPEPVAAPPAAVEAPDSRDRVASARLVIPAGTPLHVRLDTAIDTRRNREGDAFTATLSRPVEHEGRVLVPAGTAFHGHVTNAKASGRLKGRAQLGLALDHFRLNGREYKLTTTTVDRVSAAHKKRNGILIGGATGLGAALGAIAGGPKGALIGAGAGAGAGTAGAALTGKKEVGIGAETPLRFTLRAAVEL